MKRMIGFCCLLLLASRWSAAQSNEVSFSAGATFTSDQNLVTSIIGLGPCTPANCVNTTTMKASTAFTFEGSYARRLVGAGPVGLYVELPVMATPGHNVSAVLNSPLVGTINGSSSSSLFFLTPSARVKFFSSARISPWVTAGAGWMRLAQGGQSADKGAVQFGGGVDFKTGLPHLGLRGEVRDFWSGGALQTPVTIPEITSVVSPDHQHHVFAGGGVVFRF